MNATQELITKGFTISHAKNTVQDLKENTQALMLAMTLGGKRRTKEGRAKYLKLQKVLTSLEASEKQLIETETIINQIDK